MAGFTSFSGKSRIVANDAALRHATFSEIPIISLSAPLPELIDQLRNACTKVGFFYIKDHDVPQKVINDTFECAQNFFSLQRDVKDEVHYKKSAILRGYEPPAEVRTDETKKADMNEAFNWGYSSDLDPIASGSSRSLEETQVPNAMTGPNAWPTVRGFKPTLAAYYGEVLTLARRLIRLFAQVLDLPPTYFDHMFAHPGAMCRILHYPPQPPTSSAFGIGAHTDIECFTILCQGTQPALQILNTDGEWISAPPIPGTFVVNIGDMLSYWSNDLFVSTVHRVLNVTGEERYSIPFFMGPNYETVVEPLEGCVKEGKKNYESVLAGDYVWRRLAKSRFSDEEYQKMFSKETTA
ncbi:putative isopenicillin N synthetase [Cadophora sp. MPI-SDFR-AT-0126]|nr:putative isopenicillin N synthetase [Leotiomycetes sp. MPI-SDFR-AT-0126]